MIGYEAIGDHKEWLGHRFYLTSSDPFWKRQQNQSAIGPKKLFKLRFSENHRSQSTHRCTTVAYCT